MFGSLGVPELLLIFAVILIVFGPRKIPEIGRMLGKAMGEFRKATDDLKSTIEREVRLEELKKVGPAAVETFTTPFESISRSEPERVDESTSLPAVESTSGPELLEPAVTTSDSATTRRPDDSTTYPSLQVVESSSDPAPEPAAPDSSSTRRLDDSTTPRTDDPAT